MQTQNIHQKIFLALGRMMPGVILLLLTRTAEANPTGMTVQSGTASTSVNGSQLNISAGNNTFLNWQSFNIAPGETTVFHQPSAASIVWNRVNDPNPSQIFGSLQANGVVVLLNSSGFYFGPNSFVSAAGLVVSTANYAPPQNTGGAWEFNGPPPLASIVNYGTIKIGSGGSAFLIADQIENNGDIEAPGGSIGLAAGQTVMLSERPDGRGMSMNVVLPQGSVNNAGHLTADAGTIALNAKVVNQNGFIEANSVRNQDGVIELVASDALNFGTASRIVAAGDSSAGGSAGGSITLQSGNVFNDVSGSEISVAGGANGGDGGAVEISAPVMPALNTAIDGQAQAGSTGGKLLLVPDYIVLDTSGGDSVNSSGTVSVGSPGGTLHLNVGTSQSAYNDSAFKGLSKITLQAQFDITLADGTSWSLSDSTGQTSGLLTLEAGRNLIFGNSTSLYDLNNWSIALYAGVTDFAHQTVTPGAGSIYLNAFNPNDPNNSVTDPSGYIQTAAGSVTLVAGQDIIVGTGYVNTTGGGSINAHALAGNIDTGGYAAQGYAFQSADSAGGGYYVDSSHGISGMSTIAGGDVNLMAGGNVMSELPSTAGYFYDGDFYSAADDPNITTAGTGAYGFGGGQIGNVNIVAGGNVTGNYLVANGIGKIFAGVTMDASGNPVKDAAGNYKLGVAGSAGTDPANPDLALNLISGGWNVTAAQNIILQEVRNPNGDFNINPGGAFHAFDYAASDYVNLTAGNLVQLGASSSALPRLSGIDSLKVPVIYPGILNIAAGAGGVVLDGDSTYNQLILYPSPQGSLTINTTGGGSLTGDLPAISGTPQIFNLIVSDSGRDQYTQSAGGYFGLNDHKASPVHLNSETPVVLNISGSMNFMMLGAPEAAQINVVGDMNNSAFQGMNLSADPNQRVTVPVREIDGSMGTATVYPGLTSINVGQAAKINLENSGILNPATDGGLTVGGDIVNRSAFTSIDLTQLLAAGAAVPELALLAEATDNTVNGNSISAATLATSFYYNPATKILTYQNIKGVNLSGLFQLLQNLTVQKVDANGNPLWLDLEQTIPDTTTASVLDATTTQALLAEYNTLGAIPSGASGYIIGGGGKFNMTADNLDLGTTPGIQSKGVGLYKAAGNYPLASLFNRGADIEINLGGELDMYSSAIASLNGGNISITSEGDINVGSSDFSVTALGARGIFTTGQGNVNVFADGPHANINVNGSRIAAYDGGNVTVESLQGDVNAGSGGSGFVVVNAFTVDPATHNVTTSTPTIPGSGILATTFPDDAGQAVGNILVETPNGNVNTSSGGIVQLPLNNGNSQNATVEVLAGFELRDPAGNRVTAADISSGTPVSVSSGGNIDASGSGVIAENAVLKASGEIQGVVFSKNNITLDAGVGITSLTALGKSIDATAPSFGPTVTLIGTEHVNAAGAAPSQILSQDANGGGTTFAQGTVANATSQAASASDAAAPATKTDTSSNDDSLKKKKNITLARKISRVTVLLPGKN